MGFLGAKSDSRCDYGQLLHGFDTRIHSAHRESSNILRNSGCSRGHNTSSGGTGTIRDKPGLPGARLLRNARPDQDRRPGPRSPARTKIAHPDQDRRPGTNGVEPGRARWRLRSLVERAELAELLTPAGPRTSCPPTSATRQAGTDGRRAEDFVPPDRGDQAS